MKKFVLSLGLVSLLTLPQTASADPKPWIFSWGFGHFSSLDFNKRYLNNGKDVHDAQWQGRPWNPSVWIEQEKEGLELIDGFYKAGIIEDQRIKGGIPYLYVGPNFHHIGGYDQRRVVQSVDKVYQITNFENDDLFYIYDRDHGKIIGMYTKNGLQLH